MDDRAESKLAGQLRILEAKVDDIKAELERRPTRWEVRFLVVVSAAAVSQLIPLGDVGQAAMQAVPWL